MEQQIVRFDQVLARIRAFAVCRGWKPSRLAKEAGLSDMVTRGMERTDWAPSGASVRKIEALIPTDWQGPAGEAGSTAASDGEVAATAAGSETARPNA